MICPNCHREVQNGDMFCCYCGTSIQSPAPASEPLQAPINTPIESPIRTTIKTPVKAPGQTSSRPVVGREANTGYSSQQSIICRKCGEKIPNGMRICNNCGADNKAQESSVFMNIVNGNRPGGSGVRRKVCPNCGNDVPETERYCKRCGRDMTRGASSAVFVLQDIAMYLGVICAVFSLLPIMKVGAFGSYKYLSVFYLMRAGFEAGSGAGFTCLLLMAIPVVIAVVLGIAKGKSYSTKGYSIAGAVLGSVQLFLIFQMRSSIGNFFGLVSWTLIYTLYLLFSLAIVTLSMISIFIKK